MARAAASGKSRKTKAVAAPQGPEREPLLAWYRDMLLIRRFEERAGENVDDLGHGEGPGLRRNLRRRLSPFEGGTQTVWGGANPVRGPVLR